ncbi:hypothetical protein FRC00_012843 [Tulasnella sp. 408]|nr:hypothetical protein FRC00_012843 [Tulasnella sp. 408]
MVKPVSKVVYKPDSQSTDEYIAIVNPDEYKKWLEDKSVPLVEVVDSFDIFHSGQGAQGHLGKISKQTLETVFNTKNDDEAMQTLLKNGSLQSGDKFKQQGDTNQSRGARITSSGAVGGGR